MGCVINMAQVLYCGKQSVTSPWNVLCKILKMTKNSIMICHMYIISGNKGDHHVITMMLSLFWKGTREVVPVTATLSFHCHDDVIKWKPFLRYWPFVRGIHRSPVNSPHKGQWRRALMFSLICVWITGWVNNREAGDLRRYSAHYDVIVMVARTF